MSRVTPDIVSSPRVQDVRRASPPNAQHKISRRQYVALWTFMMLLHALSSAFLLSCAKLYWLMEDEYLDYFATLLAPERDRHFRVVGSALGVLGAAHALQLLGHLGASIVARKLTVRTANLGADSLSFVTIAVQLSVRLVRWAVHRWRTSREGGQRLKVPRSAFSMRREAATGNEAYGRIFAIRKTVEIATQVPNGYLYSTLIARPWINHAKVALIVANCWSAFIIHRMTTSERVDRRVAPSRAPPSPHSVRFLAVVTDALLATATGVLLPSAIFLPYLLQFDVESVDFPDSMLYGDTAFPNLVLENRAFFAISWANAAMKGVPHVSVFLCLVAIASMLDAATETDRNTPVVARPRRLPPRIGRSSIATASYHASRSIRSSRLLVQRVLRLTAPGLFLLSGAVVLALHLSAQYGHVHDNMDAMKTMCLQRTRPWLAPNVSCAVVRYNCAREGVSSPPPEALSWLEREAVSNLIFVHCAAFEMPPIVRELPFLMGIELWNVTLVSWGHEAALTARLHPMMLFVTFAFVNMTAVPVGILQPSLPEQLTDLEFIHTNLTTLPAEVAESWKSVELVYVEHSQLNSFPTVLMKLPCLSELSLIHNNIETIPEDALLTGASPYFYDLAFSRNPLRELPDARTAAFDVSYLSLELTHLTELPAWVDIQVWSSLSLGGSPVCEADSVELPELAVCGEGEEAWDPLGEERYPTQFIALGRSLDA
ncbi:hypothetical protein PHYPSEUDO_008335 [Phytophthora pseudosyringae]|uniref:Uncharacterized protein n=1 Tax=Phytophthora pseudosyringae TaxID=221518 RepID=A0A8T1VEH1_9STRA|nr:hypothetical protein PHYPSEUDO_008335 [Phytophthora pseudosyringae]